jgi:hypothetical protein
VEDKGTRKTGTVGSKLADAVQDEVNNLFSDGVVSTGVVIGSILLTTDDLLWVVELGVRFDADFVTDRRLKSGEESAGGTCVPE